MEPSSMLQSVPPQKPRTALTPRRLILMASTAVLGAGVLFSGAEYARTPNASFLTSPAYSQTVQRPVGFADIVEKVKPAVISVRVKVDGGARSMSFDGDSPFPPGSPMERFFKRFGTPDGNGNGQGMPDSPRGPRGRNFSMGQGS